jgi:putative two-component system response regulator
MTTDPRPTILVVDDAPENLAVLSQLLQSRYRVIAAITGETGLRLAREQLPDLIVLDIMMPDLDGYAVLAALRAESITAEIPVIFVTAMAEAEAEEFGLDHGAADYLTKPVKPSVLLVRVRNQLELRRARVWMAQQKAALELEVARRMRENDLTQLASIRALAHLAEIRDPETGNHILRTQGYVHRLALQLGRSPRFAEALNPAYVDLLARSAPLHDIGKVGIPDSILLKPGRLDAAEMAVMRTHAALGSAAIEQAERDVREPLAFLSVAKEIARWHHEKWDGSGYPDGLAGEDIPLSARLMAIADVFDALISRRIYKEPMSFDQAHEIISSGRGEHFDPDVTEAFLESFDDLVAIAQQFEDDPQGPPTLPFDRR